MCSLLKSIRLVPCSKHLLPWVETALTSPTRSSSTDNIYLLPSRTPQPHNLYPQILKASDKSSSSIVPSLMRKKSAQNLITNADLVPHSLLSPNWLFSHRKCCAQHSAKGPTLAYGLLSSNTIDNPQQPKPLNEVSKFTRIFKQIKIKTFNFDFGALHTKSSSFQVSSCNCKD